jgi:putative PIN family toxin of toxin-antitoxin system
VRVVLDTNAFLRGLFRPASAAGRILHLIAAGTLTLVISEPMLAELEDVLSRESVRRKIPVPDEACPALLAFIREQAQIVAITGTLQMCRDPKDDMVIETALLGRADALISEDDDLLVLSLPNCPVLPILAFLRSIDPDNP